MQKIDWALTNVAVLGAGGKMGCGIALLLLQEMTKLKAQAKDKQYILNLIDVNEAAFPPVRVYLKSQLLKFAEKNINQLRVFYADNQKLVSNEEMINAYLDQAMEMLSFSTAVESAKNAHLIFEAILEDVDTKVKAFKAILAAGNKGFFFTNTSSIPISILNEKAGLNHRLIGFHFYNPPAIQKLLEVITTPATNPELVELSLELAKRLGKTVVMSKDVAGFIGNGHMIREMAFASRKVEELSKDYSYTEAVYMINRVTQEWLLRPMGIFQLMDYVGIDVCDHISDVMQTYLKDKSLKIDLTEKLLKLGVKGGQNADGSQKEGFFRYAKGQIQAIYSLSEHQYVDLATVEWKDTVDKALGAFPEKDLSWKQLQKDPNKEAKIKTYLASLQSSSTLGAQLALEFLKHSAEISKKLVADQVALSAKDVDQVLLLGFYHLYGASI